MFVHDQIVNLAPGRYVCPLEGDQEHLPDPFLSAHRVEQALRLYRDRVILRFERSLP